MKRSEHDFSPDGFCRKCQFPRCKISELKWTSVGFKKIYWYCRGKTLAQLATELRNLLTIAK